jgi:CubicO group peptidase (beta-lactamase class C family)
LIKMSENAYRCILLIYLTNRMPIIKLMKNIFLIFLIAFSCHLFAQGQHLPQDQQNSMDSLVKTAPGTGVVVGIYANGKTSFYAVGARSVSGTARLDSATIFEVGSATKTFTGLLLALNIQRGKMGVNDYIDNYLPPQQLLPKGYRNKIKLTDLASHQSGLPNLSSDRYFTSLMEKDPMNPFRFVNKEYLYQMLKETDTLKDYGKYQYNNYAYSLLGDLIERKNNRSYVSIVEREILRPLKMESTTFAVPNTSNVAGLYDQRGAPQEKMILYAAMPAGGLKSNAVDLLKYLVAQISPTPELEPAIALTQKTFYKDQERAVGLGWDIKDGYYQKDGDTFGNSCLLRFNREKRIAVVVLSNHQNGKLVRDAVDILYNNLHE